MEKYKNCDAENLCRTCLDIITESHKKYNIFITPDLSKKLTVCTSLTVEMQDVFPKNICESCFFKINEFHEFKKLCMDSLQKYNEIIVFKKPFESGGKYETIEFDDKDNLQALTKEEPNESNEQVEVIPSENEFVTIKANSNKSLENSKNQRKTRRKQRKMNAKIESDTEIESSEDSVMIDNDTSRDVENSIDESDIEETDPTFSPTMEKEERTQFSEELKKPKKSKQKRKRRKNDSDSPRPAKDSFVFKCDLCPKKFFVEHRLMAHKRTHEGLMPYPCTFSDCDREFNRYHCFSEHIKQHEGTNRWYRCEEEGCDKVYKHKTTLSMHLRKFHKQGPELKSHICEICGKVFKAMRILQAHKFIHKDKSEFPFVCPEEGCDRRFAGREKLKIHLMRHAGIKNYVCSYCGMRKTTRNELKIHINYHTLERTWPCRFCSHVCNSAGNLKMHVRTVHERAKDYACRFCDKTFAKPDTRKYHEMTHTGEKPNECEQCGKRFLQPAALRTHRKIHIKQKLKAETASVVLETLGVNGTSAAHEIETLPRAVPQPTD